MEIINELNVEKAKKMIKSSKAKPVIVKAQNDEFNRRILEYGHFDVLLSPEAGGRARSFKRIDSGLNHVTAKIAAKNDIAIGVNAGELDSLTKEERAKRLEKIIQNIRICRKAKAKIKLLNFKEENDAFAFLVSLGASTQQAKEAF